MEKFHEVTNLRFKGNYIYLHVDGKEYKADLRLQSKKLAAAGEKEKTNFIISGSGYGIHWPDLDEDLSVDGLIGKVKSKPVQMPGVKNRTRIG